MYIKRYAASPPIGGLCLRGQVIQVKMYITLLCYLLSDTVKLA